MKILLFILSVLFTFSSYAIEEIWQYTVSPTSWAGVEAVGSDGSAAISSDSGLHWVDSSGQIVKLISSYDRVLTLSDNHLILTSGSSILYHKPNDNTEVLATMGDLSYQPSDVTPYFFCYKKNDSTIAMMQIPNNTLNSQSSTNFIPSNAVVIPSDSSGPVQIILESSEDMVNWNSANPGTYGASTNERFFRIRAVEDTE